MFTFFLSLQNNDGSAALILQTGKRNLHIISSFSFMNLAEYCYVAPGRARPNVNKSCFFVCVTVAHTIYNKKKVAGGFYLVFLK